MEDRSLNKEIIGLVKDKLDFGQKKYGSDVTLMDKRDWGEEGLEEAIDMILYLVAELIRMRALKKELNELLILIKEKQDD